MRPLRLAPIAALIALTPLGCSGGKNPKIPGTELGTYHVTGHLDASTCGPGALGSSDLWEFDVKLSRDGHDLYWLNGQDVVPGRIAADGVSFAFDSRSVIQAEPAGKGKPGCTIVRTDKASGSLQDPDNGVTGFDGLMRFGYTADPTSDCSDFIGVEGGFDGLPCELSYQVSAKRTAGPSQ